MAEVLNRERLEEAVAEWMSDHPGSGGLFIPASNEPSAVLARAFGECREGQIPRSSAALQD